MPLRGAVLHGDDAGAEKAGAEKEGLAGEVFGRARLRPGRHAASSDLIPSSSINDEHAIAPIHRGIMSIDDAIKEFLANGNISSPGIVSILSQPGERQQLYKVLLDQPLASLRNLLLLALDHEVAFRNELFNGKCEDPDDHYEGIYRCAFLLYLAGDVADTLPLWSAKHINMDVGCSLGAEYFLGAGLAGTIAYLDGWSDPDAQAILEYINEFLAYDDGEWNCREQWEFERIDNIRQA
jgi:hypothetical protein